MIPNEVYDALKWAAIIGLPALSTAYSALAGIWGLPFAGEVPQTISVLALFIGTLLGVSSVGYNQNNAVISAANTETEAKSDVDTGQAVTEIQPES